MIDTKKLIFIGSGALALIVVIIVVVVIVKNSNKNTNDMGETNTENGSETGENSGEKEKFFNAAMGAFVDPNTNVIRGNTIFTDQMVFNRDADSLLDDVKKDAYYADEGNFGAPYNLKNFNSLYENQKAIQNINNRTENQVMSESDMKSINKKLQSSLNNGKFNLYDRGGTVNTKFSVEPSGTRAVINGDYLGARDKNHQIAAVKRVIPVKGFDMDIERIPEVMARHQSSKNKTNKATKTNNLLRKPAEAAMKAVETVTEKVKDMSGASDEEVMENYQRTRTSAGFIVNGYSK